MAKRTVAATAGLLRNWLEDTPVNGLGQMNKDNTVDKRN
jgi:hypothetical protein